ncbi:MAG: LysM peptidoglycan-binding domain-containing protein [Bacteroidetes bacterium]|nr:LysM peptidoglycan-binding domain-containing protein [Bacteroidota bacterium]MBL7103766.1 LysM peptidoglycan-binding domain-containing protein [Bacteroidales bacterium]
MTVRNILISLFLAVVISSVFPGNIYPDADSIQVNDSINKKIYEISNNIINSVDSGFFVADEQNAQIIGMLDSLVAFKFFKNTTFTTDTTVLNVYNFPPDSVPVYSDSVLQARIERLNKTTPIELIFNRQVKNYINTYSIKRRELTSKVLGLSEVYFPLFEEQLDRFNMPLELKYLAVVESALNPTANSRAGAKGLWQFMYRTGKVYGLKANSLVDDRFDPYKSTIAACKHLQDLYDIYGNWSLALAAYNSGAGNVNKAIRRAGGVKSYWAVWPYLPRETRGYVPAFISVIYLMNHPAEHNLYPVEPAFLFEVIDTVTVSDVLSFNQITEMLHIPMEELKFLNPAYKTGIIPSTKDKKYTLRLPHEYVGAFIDNEQKLYAYKTKKGIDREKLLAEIKKAKERNIHIVRYGENLGLIAKKYRCSVRNLKSWNNLRGNTIYPGQKLVIFAPGYVSSKKSSTTKPTNIKNRDEKYHVVKNGENLGLIAKKYKCSVSDLKKWNNLKSNTIHPNQKLLVYAPKSEAKESKITLSNKVDTDYVYHTIRKGDTLWDIAKLYNGVTVEQIKKLNNIKNSKKIKPGQKIKVTVKG